MNFDRVFKRLAAVRTDEVVITTMTATYIWPKHSTSDRDFCFIAPMGGAAPMGLGLALARPDVRVWVLDSEGSLLMNLGVLVTIAAQRPNNLVHLVMNNGIYDITGGQPIVGSNGADLAGIARAAGIPSARKITSASELDGFIGGELRSNSGPVFADIHVEPSYDRTAVDEYTASPQALKTQGGPGYHNLHKVLNG